MNTTRFSRVILLLTWLAVDAFAACDVSEVELQAAADRDADTDLMVAELAVESEDPDPSALAERINHSMKWALEQAKSFPEVKLQGGTYSIHPVYIKQRLTHWRGRQALRLESEALAELGNLVGVLQSRLTVQGVEYRLSPKKREAVENELITTALALLKERATILQSSLGASAYTLSKLKVATEMQRPPVPVLPMQAETLAPAADNQAWLTPGSQQVGVQVLATIKIPAPDCRDP